MPTSSAGFPNKYTDKATWETNLFQPAITLTKTGDALSKIGDKVDDPLSMYLNDIATIPVNLAGLGSMSLPSGVADEDGLPVGFQITAPVMKDDLLYQVGGTLEAALLNKWGSPLLSKVTL